MTLFELYCRGYQTVMRCATPVLDWSEPQLLTGPGSVAQLPALVKSKGLRRVLVVTDPALMKLGLPGGLLKGLEDAGIYAAVYDRTNANPTIQNIEEARQMYLDNACEGIIAFGGGSPMDCAKICGARIARPNKSIPQMRGLLKVMKALPPLFAIPTTAGTGSEVTLAAVVANPETHEKYPINDPKLRPIVAVLDAELTIGLPAHITAATGMDALTHAVEAYIGHSNTAKTASKALNATRLIFGNLETAYTDGQNLTARSNMLIASYDAGIAFTRAYVGYCHAVAHALGGLYNVPHGLANAVILPHLLDFFGSSADDRLADLADAAGIAPGKKNPEKAKAFIAQIRAMNDRMGIPRHFDCIKEADIPGIAERAMKEANPLYPVPKIMVKSDFEAFIQSLMAEAVL